MEMLDRIQGWTNLAAPLFSGPKSKLQPLFHLKKKKIAFGPTVFYKHYPVCFGGLQAWLDTDVWIQCASVGDIMELFLDMII